MNLKKSLPLLLTSLGFGALATSDLIRSKGLKKHQKAIEEINSNLANDTKDYPMPKKIHGTKIDRIVPADQSSKEVYTMLHPKGEQAYIIAPPSASKTALEHELGHVKAKYHESYPNLATRSLAKAYKPTFKKTKIKAEEEAWSYLPPSQEKHVLKHHALSTYEKEFHRNRGIASLAASMLAASPYLLKR
jgi:hypothetical protein